MSDSVDPFEKMFGKKEYNADGELVFHVTIDESSDGRGFDIRYGAKGFGFGGCQIYTRDNKVLVDTECLGLETLTAIIKQGARQIATALLRHDPRYERSEIPVEEGYRTAEQVRAEFEKDIELMEKKNGSAEETQ